MWFKVDDQLAFHRKTIAAGNAAVGLWVRAGSWLRQPGNGRADAPGTLTLAEARTMGSSAQVKALIDAELWHPCKLKGAKAVRFHDWDEYQPAAEELTDKRDEWATRKRRSRKHKRGDHSECLFGHCDDAPPPESEEWGRDHA